MAEIKQHINILVVEDEKVNQKVVKQILNKWGQNVDVADNGKKALLMLEERNYDLILMDIQMPELDGIQTTKFIRKNEVKTKKAYSDYCNNCTRTSRRQRKVYK